MGIKYETKLPAPGVDIIRTPHVRTFIPGSGGPHLDTLLQNQITILRQNQEIRTQLALLLDDQNAVSVVPVVKKNILTEMKLMMSEGLIRAAVQVSRTYHRQRGDTVMKVLIASIYPSFLSAMLRRGYWMLTRKIAHKNQNYRVYDTEMAHGIDEG